MPVFVKIPVELTVSPPVEKLAADPWVNVTPLLIVVSPVTVKAAELEEIKFDPLPNVIVPGMFRVGLLVAPVTVGLPTPPPTIKLPWIVILAGKVKVGVPLLG